MLTKCERYVILLRPDPRMKTKSKIRPSTTRSLVGTPVLPLAVRISANPTDRFVRPLVTTPGRKLKLLQRHDPLKQWWSLDEMRFCARCEHLFLGTEIRFMEDELATVYFHCPTHECEGGLLDWEYPDLHL
jgi:hypothetical protein